MENKWILEKKEISLHSYCVCVSSLHNQGNSQESFCQKLKWFETFWKAQLIFALIWFLSLKKLMSAVAMFFMLSEQSISRATARFKMFKRYFSLKNYVIQVWDKVLLFCFFVSSSQCQMFNSPPPLNIFAV